MQQRSTCFPMRSPTEGLPECLPLPGLHPTQWYHGQDATSVGRCQAFDSGAQQICRVRKMEVTFLRRCLAHCFEGLELGSWSLGGIKWQRLKEGLILRFSRDVLYIWPYYDRSSQQEGLCWGFSHGSTSTFGASSHPVQELLGAFSFVLAMMA